MIDLKSLNKFYIDDFVKDFFIGFYQALFHENSEGNEFYYDPDKEVTRLNIADQFSIDDLTPEFKPTIYIRRRPLSFMNTSIDQMINKNLMASTSTHTDLIGGVVEIVSVAREGLEASRLAGLIFLLTQQFKGELRKHGMFDVAVKGLGEEEPKDVRSTFRVVEVPVSIQIMFQYSWAVQAMNLQVMNEIEASKSSNPVTGEDLIGVPFDGCNGGTGVSTGEDEDGNTKICIPLSSDSPK